MNERLEVSRSGLAASQLRVSHHEAHMFAASCALSHLQACMAFACPTLQTRTDRSAVHPG